MYINSTITRLGQILDVADERGLIERNPVRVTFAPNPGQKLTFSVKSHAIDAITQDESEGGE